MSTLAIPSSPYQHSFSRELAWHNVRPESSSKPHERIALPSIRQTFPELQLQIQEDFSARIPHSSTVAAERSSHGTMTQSEYIHSPIHQKRRRPSFEYRREPERENSVPRCTSLREFNYQPLSPSTFGRVATNTWNPSERASPPPGTFLEHLERVEVRTRLPTLPLLNLPQSNAKEYAQERLRTPSITSSNSHGTEGGSPAYQPTNFGYSYHHPSRVQSLSVGSVHSFDRMPFSPSGMSPGPYGHQFHDTFMRIRDYNIGVNGEGKQRKRRGNLPKETTDKLRTWFIAHLHHPYPSEEEKQELMRETGLQLNQISNWFINARRRQLPTMISNARAESDATLRDSKLIPSTERAEYESDGKPASDSEGSNFQDAELESIKRRRVTNSRGSI